MKFSIRNWTALCGAAVLANLHSFAAEPGAGVGIGPSFKGPVGLQLYSLRAELIRNVPKGLDQVQEFGFRNVELAGTYNLTPERFKAMLDERGLRPVSGHFPFERLRDDIDGVVRDAKVFGLQYVGCAWVPHDGDFDEKECREAIRVFNDAGGALSKEGMRFFYHPHGYEFRQHGEGTLFDLMMGDTRPDRVSYEMDVFWIVHPGQDPVKLLRKYGKRWELMHLKDMKKGLQTGVLTGKADVTNDVALGTGQMDWPAILHTAAEVGVKWYFIEDESPTVVEQIPQTLRYLETVKW